MRFAFSLLVVTLTACGAPEPLQTPPPESPCMRTLSAQESALLTLKHYGTWSRVDVDRNGAGVWVDLTTLSGINWVVGVDRAGSIDNPVDTLTVTLAREVGPLSLSPLVQTSPLNTYLGSYVPVLDVGRRIKAYEAMVPLGAAPQSSDWRLVFDGYIDTVDVGVDGTVGLQARDLGGKLQDSFIETVRNYGSSGGIAAETVMQSILDDSPLSITLYVPVSPGFNILTYAQAKEPLMDALRKIAQNFGWEVGYKWRAATAQFELTLYGPDRAKVVPDRTVYPDEVHKYGKSAIDRANVRNVVRVIYPDATSGERTSLLVQDVSSITRYGRRYMEVAEAASSQIDTVGEATTMANAILSDLKDPVLDAEPEVNGFWAVELGDLWRLKAGTYKDGPVFTSDQDLAVRTFRSSIRGDGVGTLTVGVGGKPSAGYRRWLEMQGRPGVAPATDTTTPTTPANPAGTADMASITITYDQPTDPDWSFSECYVDTSNPVVPSEATLKARGPVTTFVVGGLNPGTTYYAKVLAVNKAGNKSLASTQVAVATSLVGPSNVDTRQSNVNLVPNGELCIYTPPHGTTVTPPDRWNGANFIIPTGWHVANDNANPDIYWNTGGYGAATTDSMSGDKAVVFTSPGAYGGSGTPVFYGLRSTLIPVKEGELYWISAMVKYHSPGGGFFPRLEYSFLASASTGPNAAGVSSGNTVFTGTQDAWNQVTVFMGRAPATARWLRVTIGGVYQASPGPAAAGDTVTIDSVHVARGMSSFAVNAGTQTNAIAGAWTKVVLNTAASNNGSDWSAANNRYVVSATDAGGVFSFTGSVSLLAAANLSVIKAALYKNGAIWKEGPTIVSNGTTPWVVQVQASSEVLAAGDYIELYVWNGDIANRLTEASAVRTYFQGSRDW